MFRSLSMTDAVRSYAPYRAQAAVAGMPARKSLSAPFDNGSFIKPVKQCFVRNPRTMPMTRIMLLMLAGWAGQGGVITTTQGIIAKKLDRCTRQVIRYLQDAMEEGLLIYWPTKDRLGYYTGIKIWLNFGAIRYKTKRKKAANTAKTAEIRAMTLTPDTNENSNIKRGCDDEFRKFIEDVCHRSGIKPPD